MKITKNILGIISFMVLIMSLVYGGYPGAYVACFCIFLMTYFFGGIDIVEERMNIKLNVPSHIFLIAGLIFIYLSLYENVINIYNIITSICCTLIFWLFVIYLNINDNEK